MKKLRFKRSKIANPKTYYDSLGEDGYLEEYMRENLHDKFDSDIRFREEMIGLLFKYANNVIPEVEKYYLEKLSDKLNEFLECARQWRTAKP